MTNAEKIAALDEPTRARLRTFADERMGWPESADKTTRAYTIARTTMMEILFGEFVGDEVEHEAPAADWRAAADEDKDPRF